MKLHKRIFSTLTEASGIVQATGRARAISQFKLSMWVRGTLVGALLLILFLPPSEARLTMKPTELSEMLAAAQGQPGQPIQIPCNITPNSAKQGEMVPAAINLGPHQVVSQIIALVPAAQLFASSSVSFEPAGVQAMLFQASYVQTTLISYTGTLTVAPDAALGARNLLVAIQLGFGGPPTQLTCAQAFTVTGGGPPPPPQSFFNGPPLRTLPVEPMETTCAKRGEDPSYGRGVGQVAVGEACGGKWPPTFKELFTRMRNIAGPGTVLLHGGEFTHYVVDLEIPGCGFNWKFERKYRSGVTFDGPLGANWEFNYNRRLFFDPTGVTRMDGYGRADRYEFVSGRYVAPDGFYTRLTRTGDGTFTERDRSGTTVIYGRPDTNGMAPMTSLSDRDGNTMRFSYNSRGQLTQVLDTLGRPINYFYNSQNRLVEVRDFAGRSITFEYDGRGDLVAATSPAVTGTPTGNDFPLGKTERYAYLDRTDKRLKHNLVSITAPNEVALGGPPRIQIQYETNPQSPNFERALSQTIGGLNDSGIPAGGMIKYDYRTLRTAPANDFNTAVSQTVVTDRNGNLTEYQFNQLGNIVRVREMTNRNIRPGDPEYFETRYEYNQDGEVLRIINPEGNSTEYVYDNRNSDRFQQGNILREIHRPDSERGGDQTTITKSYTYEPVYNQVRTVVEARGNDSRYTPQNGGAASAARYTTTSTFDYQEGNNLAALAAKTGLTQSALSALLQAAGVQLNLGDLNGDGATNQIGGKVIRKQSPTVQLLTGSNQATVEGGTGQPIRELYAYNAAGQISKRVDPEGNVELYDYFPENDPDGDGLDLTQGVGTNPVGYLRSITSDATGAPERNSRTNPSPLQIRRRFFYDRVGNVTREIDGRGVATDYAVN